MAEIKNTEIDGDTLVLPVGNTSEREAETAGALRFNTDEGTLEIFNGSIWEVKQTFAI